MADVFKLTPPAIAATRSTETNLYYFQPGADGANPFSELYMDAGGALYGTTANGGVSSGRTGCGAIFKVGP